MKVISKHTGIRMLEHILYYKYNTLFAQLTAVANNIYFK